MPDAVDVQCWRCKKDGKGTYRTRSRCSNCGWEGIAIHSLGHNMNGSDDCPRCECHTIEHVAVLAQPAQHVQPLVQVQFQKAWPERADEWPMFVWGYRS